jgi:hypothetical protein
MQQHRRGSQPVYIVYHSDTIPIIPPVFDNSLLEMPGFADSFWSGDYAGGKTSS